jgi:CCR4-NOT transcription complex subunit 1
MRVLAANAGVVPTDTLQQLKLVQAVAVQAHPELAAVVADAGGMEAFPPDVEEEANATFQRVYSGDLSVDALVAALRGYKNSTLGREQEVFACMVHNLFDEFRFFPRYPDKELHTTALLFGQLVAHGLVASVSLGIALRYVLDALRAGPAPPNAKMFHFGATAARQFAGQLAQYAAFAGQLAALPGLREWDPELLAAAEAGAAKAAVASSAAAEQARAAEAAAAAAPAPVESPGLGAAAASSGGGGGAGVNVAAAAFNAAGFPTAMPAAPANPNMLFSTINAETLEQAAQSVSYPVPDEKVGRAFGSIL